MVVGIEVMVVVKVAGVLVMNRDRGGADGGIYPKATKLSFCSQKMPWSWFI